MKVKLGGAEIEYDVRGEGPAVVFLHAFPLGQFMWDRVVAALEPSHRVLRFDARGFGGTPPGDGPLSMDRIADDAAALMDHVGMEKAVVAGCSMGGFSPRRTPSPPSTTNSSPCWPVTPLSFGSAQWKFAFINAPRCSVMSMV